MTIENNKKYQLSGEQLTDLAARLSILGSEAEEKAEKALSGPLAPTDSTPGQIGQLYVQDDGTVYILKDIIEESGDESGALAQFIWEEFGGGSIKTLGSSDYNYPTSGTADGIALWLLDTGDYLIEAGTNVYYTTTSQSQLMSSGLFEVTSSYDVVGVRTMNPYGNESLLSIAPDGSSLIKNAQVIDSSSLQQSTGTLTTYAMSQNATTSMVFADPSTKYNVQIGSGASASGTNSIAIGRTASATGNSAVGIKGKALALNSVAIGGGAQATAQGQFDIGTSNGATTGGYNNTSYRLLTGLYDPQSAHDAATKGYVDTSITSAVGQITSFSYQVVSTLPQTGTKGVIYLVPTEESGDPQNIFEEYIWIIDEEDSGDTGRFELIGTTEIDLSDYVTTSDLQTTLSNYATTSDVNTAISGVEQEIGSLSGSGAPTSATEGTVGQTYVDSSTGDIYYLSEIIEESGQADTYVWKSFASGDTITPLTSADYNWNNTAGDATTTPFDSIALWLLDPGIYTIAEEGIYIKGEISHRTSMRVGNTILITPPTAAGPYIIKGVFFTSGEEIFHYSPITTTGSNFTHKGRVLCSDSIGYARLINSELYNAASQSGGANDYCQIWRLPSGTYYGVFDTVLVQEYSQGPLIPSDDTIYIISDVSGGLGSRCILKITTEGAYKLNFTSGEYVSTERLLTEGDISITMTNTDPGEGATVGENEYIAVYGGDPIILDYSTSEVNTGTKWIDGSAIYKKTINFGALPSSGSKNMAHSIANFSTLVDIKAMLYDTVSLRYKPLNLPQGNNTDWVVVEVNDTNVYAYVGSDFSNTTAYITLYYTKSS